MASKYLKDNDGNIWEQRMVFTAAEFEQKKDQIRSQLTELQSWLDKTPEKMAPDEETLAFWKEYHEAERQTIQDSIKDLESKLEKLENVDYL